MQVKYNCFAAAAEISYSDFIKLDIVYKTAVALFNLVSICFLKFNFLSNHIFNYFTYIYDFNNMLFDKVIESFKWFLLFLKWINSDFKLLNYTLFSETHWKISWAIWFNCLQFWAAVLLLIYTATLSIKLDICIFKCFCFIFANRFLI